MADGTANGIRHAELGNWTGQALLIPRSLLAQVKTWPEVVRPGVYFLVGPETASSKREAYIGEAEQIFTRLEQHLSKDFWEQAIAFTNKDENLTKAHVRYLEAALIREATEADRYSLHNKKTTDVPSLPRGDRDMMDEYIDHLKVLLGALGHPVLDPIVPVIVEGHGKLPQDENLFFFTSKDASASGIPTPEGFVVLEGSTARVGNTSTSNPNLKATLLTEQILAPISDGLLAFKRSHLFKSPSAAAAIVCSHDVNGRASWKLKDGSSLKEWEAKQLASPLG